MNKVVFLKLPELAYSVSEAINTLCANLSFSGSDKKVIMTTSCKAGEGKSFVSTSIWRTLAKLGHKVVLVDADLRRSQVAGGYGMRIEEGNKYGLPHYLAGKCNIEDVIYKVEGISNAYVIPAVRAVGNSLALLRNKRFPALLDSLKENFEYIIIDAPPVGVIIDAAEIAKHCDGTVLVVKYNAIARKELIDVKHQIERTGCEVLGAVLNVVDMDTISSKKYYNKGYSSKYESEYFKSDSRQKKKKRLKKRSSK